MTLTLEESSARCGGHCWIERRAFEVFGSWGAAVSAPAAKILLDRLSLHAAWRAEQWWDRLPFLAGVERDDLVVAPAGWRELLGPGGAHLAGADTDVEVVAVAARVVLARTVARYRAHRAETSPIADGAVIRTLGHTADDARADWEAAEALVQSLLLDEAAVAATAGAVGRAEAVLARSSDPG